MKNAITITESLTIQASQKEVWDFTQDFNNRVLWDDAVLQSEVIQKQPFKLVRLQMKGGIQTILKYKLCRKLLKTSLVMTNTRSILFKGGGGSWTYNAENGAVEWRQVNTLIMRHKLMYWCLGRLIKHLMTKQTREAMFKAKVLIENHGLRT